MKCPHCGMEDPVLRDYCISCGAKLDYSSEESEILLIEAKRADREKRVAKRVRSWVAVTVAVFVGLITFRVVTKAVTHEEVDAYFPPPVVELASPNKLPIAVARLPVPIAKPHNIRIVKQKEPDIVRTMVQNIVTRYAPEHRLMDGRKVRGFIVKPGASPTILTADGKTKVYAIAAPEGGK